MREPSRRCACTAGFGTARRRFPWGKPYPPVLATEHTVAAGWQHRKGSDPMLKHRILTLVVPALPFKAEILTTTQAEDLPTAISCYPDVSVGGVHRSSTPTRRSSLSRRSASLGEGAISIESQCRFAQVQISRDNLQSCPIHEPL